MKYCYHPSAPKLMFYIRSSRISCFFTGSNIYLELCGAGGASLNPALMDFTRRSLQQSRTCETGGES